MRPSFRLESIWSVTVDDAKTRSEIATEGSRCASVTVRTEGRHGVYSQADVRSQRAVGRRHELDQDDPRQGMVRLLPDLWPEAAAFDDNWKPGDFTEVT